MEDEKVYQCITYGCKNCSDQGNGVFFDFVYTPMRNWICWPCYEFLTEGIGRYSQVYRNAKELK